MARTVLVALFAYLIVWLGASAGHAQGPDSVEFEAAITLANGRLQTGNNADAFTQAEKAIGIDPARFEGYYFAGVALLRQSHPDRALAYFRDALRRAPETERVRVQNEIKRAETADRANTKVQEAREAEAAGNYFTAALAYTAACEIAPTHVTAGQSAVRLWLVLQEPAKAARQLRRLAMSDDATIRNDATQQLNGLGGQLTQIARESTARGWQLTDQAASAQDSRLEAAADNFLRAIDAAPIAGGADSPHMGMVVTRARQNDKTKMLAAFKVAAAYSIVPDASYFDRTGTASCSVGCRRDQALAPYLCAPDVQPSLQGIFGPSVVQASRDFCAAYTRRQNDLVARLAREEERRRREEAEQLVRETAKKAGDYASLGWTLLGQAGKDPRDPKWESAAQAFSASIAALPRVGGAYSPHMGLVIARAAQQQKDAFLLAFRSAAASGMVPDSLLYYDLSGQACNVSCDRDIVLAPYLCTAESQSALEDLYGPAGSRIAREFCANRDRRLRELAQAMERQREAREQRRQFEEQQNKILGDLKNLLMTQPNACFAGQNKGLTECLCVTRFEATTSNITYKMRITGTLRRQIDGGWAEERYDVTGAVQAHLTVSSSLTEVAISQTGVISGSGRIDLRYNFGLGDPTAGVEAFISGTTELGATVWSIRMPDGAVIFSSGKYAFSASRVTNGCGF